MRLTASSLRRRGSVLAAAAAGAQDLAPGRSISLETSTRGDSRYAGRVSGPQQRPGADRALLAQSQDRPRRTVQHREHLRRHHRHRRFRRRGVDRSGEADARRQGRARPRADRRRRSRRPRRRPHRARTNRSDRNRRDHVSVDYTVTVPASAFRRCALDIRAASRSPASTAPLRAETVSGDVTITDAPRLETAKTVSGDVWC